MFDYKSLGFKAGLEIHQELDTSTKLFCRCPTYLRHDPPHFLLKRFFRPVMGELGEFDPAMLVEYKKNRVVIYEGYDDTTCTYEIDETPPFELNRDALKIGLQIVLLLNATPIDEIHTCRKNYLDGSVPCGFQRTMIIGKNGYIPLGEKKIRISTISIEEDAARKVKVEGRKVYYRLDRLGIPLVELVTEPDIETPEELVEAAYRLGLLLRSTKCVKRGLGTIRQDINLSISGGARVELKGVQKLDWIPRLVENEVKRQMALIKIRDELKKRKVRKTDFTREFADLSDVLKNTKCKFIKTELNKGKIVLGVRIPNFKGLLGLEVQPGKTFGYEIAERVMVIAGLKGLIHSDEHLSKYGFTESEIENIRSRLKLSENDAFAIVVGDREQAEKAMNIIVDRCILALQGVPNETRMALENGNSKFERELHGGARLYPDTDTPPIAISEKLISEVKETLPKYPWELEKEISEKYKISIKIARNLILSDKLEVFRKLVDEIKIEPTLAHTTLLETIKALERESVPVENLSDNHILDTFRLVANKEIGKEGIAEVLKELAKHPEIDAKKAADNLGLKALPLHKVEEIINNAVKRNIELIRKKNQAAFAPIMGEIMKEVRGKIDGKVVADILKKKISNVLGSGVNNE
ncbi:MAG: Glu-tRNA(Gln) amidotransferase subunit GatE [Candidatus Odinarchaeia archaeon]